MQYKKLAVKMAVFCWVENIWEIGWVWVAMEVLELGGVVVDSMVL